LKYHQYPHFSNQQLTYFTALLNFCRKVQFAIGSEVWINPLLEMALDPISKVSIKKESVRLAMIRKRDRNPVAENNPSHMKRILKLCLDTGFECPELIDCDIGNFKSQKCQSYA
jgi:hypothetical protein